MWIVRVAGHDGVSGYRCNLVESRRQECVAQGLVLRSGSTTHIVGRGASGKALPPGNHEIDRKSWGFC
jgi:hypothetical protein